MAHTSRDAGEGGASGGRRPRSEDPRSIITPDAFHVEPSLLGAPLASPSRRLVAMLIDLILLGFLVNAPGWLFALFVAVVLFRATSRRSGSKGGVGRFFLRAAGALIAFIGVLSLVSAVSGLFSGGGDETADVPEARVEVAEMEEDGEAPEGAVDEDGGASEDGPGARDGVVEEDRAASGDERDAPVEDEGRGAGAGSAGDDEAASGPPPAAGAGIMRELLALGRAETAEEARPHAAAVGRFFAARGERLEGPEDLREVLRGVGELPLMSIDEDLYPVLEEEFRRVGFLVSAGMEEDEAARAAAIDSLLLARQEALAAGTPEDAGRLLREAALLAAADTIGRLGSRISSLRSDVDDLEDRAREAQRSAERSPLQLLMDLVADEVGVSAGWAALYFTAMLALWRGRTPGKRALGIRVIRLDGKPLGWFASFERFGGYAAALATGTLGFFQILWDRNRQGVHDKISETVVIRDLPPEHVVRKRVATA